MHGRLSQLHAVCGVDGATAIRVIIVVEVRLLSSPSSITGSEFFVGLGLISLNLAAFLRLNSAHEVVTGLPCPQPSER